MHIIMWTDLSRIYDSNRYVNTRRIYEFYTLHTQLMEYVDSVECSHAIVDVVNEIRTDGNVAISI